MVAGLTATLLGGMVGDKLRGRFPGSYFLVSGAAMLAGFPFVIALLRAPFPWVWLFLFAACFCLFFNTGPTNTILANVTQSSIRATGFALNIFFIHSYYYQTNGGHRLTKTEYAEPLQGVFGALNCRPDK